MKIRFDHPTALRINFRPGDELTVSVLPPELEGVLNGTRLDGEKVAHIVDDDEDETAVVTPEGETATTGRGRRREQRATTVPG